MILVGLLFIGMGLLALLSPKSAWYLSYGWRYQDAEPSDTALVVERITGGIFVIVGLFMVFS